jgi:hypothetical protein
MMPRPMPMFVFVLYSAIIGGVMRGVVDDQNHR